jgi:hypothetical protein
MTKRCLTLHDRRPGHMGPALDRRVHLAGDGQTDLQICLSRGQPRAWEYTARRPAAGGGGSSGARQKLIGSRHGRLFPKAREGNRSSDVRLRLADRLHPVYPTTSVWRTMHRQGVPWKLHPSRPEDRNMECPGRSKLPFVKARELDRLAVSLQKYDRCQMQGIECAHRDWKRLQGTREDRRS